MLFLIYFSIVAKQREWARMWVFINKLSFLINLSEETIWVLFYFSIVAMQKIEHDYESVLMK